MYHFLSILTGVLISIMIACNGELGAQYGAYSATVFVHITGLILIAALVLVKRERPFSQKHPWFLYLGGAIGVLTTVFPNLAFSRISVSAILALGLFGQSITGLVFDQYGFFQMPLHPFRKRKLIGLFLTLCGIIAMIDKFEIWAVVLSFASGITIVTSRTLNAKLAELTSMQISTFFNYVVGLLTAIPVLFLLGRSEISPAQLALSPNPLIYLGGLIGVGVILLSNVTVGKISAFYLTLLIFIGQVFSGICIDILITQVFSTRNLIGGILGSAGLYVNLLLDKRQAADS